MFTKKQIALAIVLIIIAVVFSTALELSSFAISFIVLAFILLGVYFFYHNAKEKDRNTKLH